jgi:hypothetical protein
VKDTSLIIFFFLAFVLFRHGRLLVPYPIFYSLRATAG